MNEVKFIDPHGPEARATAAVVWENYKKLTDADFVEAASILDGYPNPSGILPTEFKLLILPNPVAEKTKGGIILPDDAREAQQFATTEGVMVAAAPGAFSFLGDEEWGNQKPIAGDTVIYGKYSGKKVTGDDGKEYLLLADKELCGIRRKVTA